MKTVFFILCALILGPLSPSASLYGHAEGGPQKKEKTQNSAEVAQAFANDPSNLENTQKLIEHLMDQADPLKALEEMFGDDAESARAAEHKLTEHLNQAVIDNVLNPDPLKALSFAEKAVQLAAENPNNETAQSQAASALRALQERLAARKDDPSKGAEVSTRLATLSKQFSGGKATTTAATPAANNGAPLEKTGGVYTRGEKKVSEFKLEDGSRVHSTNETTANGEKILSVDRNGKLYRFTDSQLGLEVREDGSIHRVSQSQVQATPGGGVIELESGKQVSMETHGDKKYWFNTETKQIHTASVHSDSVTSIAPSQLPKELIVSAQSRLVRAATPEAKPVSGLAAKEPIPPIRPSLVAGSPAVPSFPRPTNPAADGLDLKALPPEIQKSISAARDILGPGTVVVCTEEGCQADHKPGEVLSDPDRGVVHLRIPPTERASVKPGAFDVPDPKESSVARPTRRPDFLKPDWWKFSKW